MYGSSYIFQEQAGLAAVLTKTDTVWPCLASIATFTPTFNFNVYVLYDILFIAVHHALTLYVHLGVVLHLIQCCVCIGL